MITMRSNPTSKINKPPPPVPPRPSKTVVAEALAKSRKDLSAPPGPLSTEKWKVAPPVVKSQSYSSINNYDKVVKIERGHSVEEPPKPATRTLVYQSSNSLKKGTIHEIKVNVNRSESFKRDNNISRTSSFKTPKDSNISRNSSFKTLDNVSKTNLSNNCYENTANIQFKTKDLISRDSSLESLGESVDLSRSNSFKTNDVVSSIDSVISEDDNKLDNNWNENDRNHVNTLIDEMFASVLDLPEDKETVEVINENVTLPNKIRIHNFAEAEEKQEKTVLVIENTENLESPKKNVHFDSNSIERPKINDKHNHELLISELTNMKKDFSKRQRKPSETKIQHSDWVEVNNGQEIRLSSCQITIENDNNRFNSRRSEMSNLHGLPPLPKSLSGFNLIESPQTPVRPGSSRNISPGSYSMYPQKNPSSSSSNGELGSLKKGNNLDAKLALLRREMVSEYFFI